MTKSHPMIFSGPMVQAILEDRKSQTRRVLKPQPEFEGVKSFGNSWGWRKGDDWFSGVTTDQMKDKFGLLHPKRCKYQPGDLLWVKEAWWMWCEDADDTCPCEEKGLPNPKHHVEYRATHPDKRPGGYDDETAPEYGIRWKSPLFMPRWASRITLEVTGARIERVQEIDMTDAYWEGCSAQEDYNGAYDAFIETWHSLYPTGPKSWNANPWVVVIEFKQTKPSMEG